MRRLSWTVPIGWLTVVGLWSVGMMHAAFVHNPQGEFQHQVTGVIDWGALWAVGANWFIVLGVLPAVVLGGIAWAVSAGSARSRGDND